MFKHDLKLSQLRHLSVCVFDCPFVIGGISYSLDAETTAENTWNVDYVVENENFFFLPLVTQTTERKTIQLDLLFHWFCSDHILHFIRQSESMIKFMQCSLLDWKYVRVFE